jgi:hypothetical protein
MYLIATLSIKDTPHNDTRRKQRYYAKCRYAEWHYAECHYTECRHDECRYAKCRGTTYYTTELLMSVKRFIVQFPGACAIKSFGLNLLNF